MSASLAFKRSLAIASASKRLATLNLQQKTTAPSFLQLFKSQRNGQIRFYSSQNNSGGQTTQPITKEEAKSRASALLEWFPGQTLSSKAAYVTIGAGLTSFLVAKDIYIFNEEGLIAIAFLIFSRFLWMQASPAIRSGLDSHIEETKKSLSVSMDDKKKTLVDEISKLENLKDFADVVSGFYAVQKENVALEGQAAEASAYTSALQSIKNLLDEKLKVENQRLAAERKELVARVIAAALAELTDPKNQEAILNESLAQVESLNVEMV